MSNLEVLSGVIIEGKKPSKDMIILEQGKGRVKTELTYYEEVNWVITTKCSYQLHYSQLIVFVWSKQEIEKHDTS